MKNAAIAFAFAALASTAFGADFKGVISDAMCGKKHTAASLEDQACVKKCIKGPDDAVLITTDNQVLKIDPASFSKVKTHLGQEVLIRGKVTGDTLTIDSIKSS
jgi:hypothetical protein